MSSTHICHITDLKSLEELCQNNTAVLLVVVRSFLPRCKRFSPAYPDVASALAASGATIQCVQAEPPDASFALKFEFYGYQLPTILYFRGTEDPKKYRGPLKKDDILEFVERQDKPTISNVTSSSQLDEIRKAHSTVAAAFLGEGDGTLRGHFVSVAEKMKDDIVFCVSTIPEVAAAEGVNVPSVAVYKHIPEKMSILESPSSVEEIHSFVQDTSRPLISEFLPEVHDAFIEQPLPLGFILLPASSSDESTEDFVSSLLPVARRYRSQVLLGTASETLFSDLATDSHLTTASRPAFFILSAPPRRGRYPLNYESGPATSIEAHISAFLAGALEPAIKSAPIPATQDSPVIEVVGLTYDSIVLDPNVDVLLEFYTPWCGPCKPVAKIFEELARGYNADIHDGNDGEGRRVVFARVDCENNDIPDRDVRGFPWFKLYPAGRKDDPITYKGVPTIEGWREFLEKEGSGSGLANSAP